jgi:membrane protein DedA with SNARE-associated domain
MPVLDQLIRLFTEHGYLAVFGVLFISGLGLPIPEDITLTAGGIIAGLGYANPHVMCVIGLVGVLFGDSMMYLLGHFLGARALHLRWVSAVVTPRRYAKVQHRFDRYGNRMLFVARFLPGLRTAVFLIAGMTHRVSFARFILFDGSAALISVPFWVYLGYFGAENHELVLAWIKRGESAIAVGAVVLVVVVGWLWWRRRARARSRLRAFRAHRAARHARSADPH